MNSEKGVLNNLVRWCLQNKLIVGILLVVFVGWGVIVSPFDWEIGWLPRHPVPVDAIPDIGENQQIVFTEWVGRSPQDVEDQVTYPLTVALLGVPGVKTIRSLSMFGYSFIYVIFEEDVDFYWSRSRILEKLNSLPPGTLPEDAHPSLGPDATGLGQVFWYTLEGRSPDGSPVGGWDLDELRTIQDWYVRYALQSAEGVSEVASVGGFVREYQVDVDPAALWGHGVTVEDVFRAVQGSNIDVGAANIELNKVEYLVRSLGFIKSLEDLRKTVIRERDGVPLLVEEVANVSLGPALRRGALDKDGAEAVGGVVTVRYGYNPLQAIKNVKAKIAEIAPALPEKVWIDYAKITPEQVREFAREQGFEAYVGGRLNHESWLNWMRRVGRDNWPEWVTISKVTIVPFYDRTKLIYETLGTLNRALVEEILVTCIVILAMVGHLRSSLLISLSLPLAVLMCFIAMKVFGVDANIVALSGIAIAIGTMVDMGIVLCENIIQHLERRQPGESSLQVVYRATTEVASAVLTAVATTVISFLPVFTMIGPEGKLFRPLAFTKTFALIASVVVAIFFLPPAAHLLFPRQIRRRSVRTSLYLLLLLAAVPAYVWFGGWAAGLVVAVVAARIAEQFVPERWRIIGSATANAAAIVFVAVLLTKDWLPLGPELGLLRNLLVVAVSIGGLLGFFYVFRILMYERLLRWALRHKLLFLTVPTLVAVTGACVWLGAGKVLSFIPATVRVLGGNPNIVTDSRWWSSLVALFPGLGREFMPALDEGSFLYMPSTMPHASIGEAMDALRKEDLAIRSIPEVETVVGKIGRVESALDPAPIGMVETIIQYKPEYIVDETGRIKLFKYDEEKGEFVRDEQGNLIEDPNGRPFRQWRPHIKSPDDIWEEIARVAQVPGSTSAPKLQPIETRLVMLQTGMRAAMGVKVLGPDLRSIEQAGIAIERFLKEVPSVDPATVVADRVIGKPYIEIQLDREAIARYGLTVQQVQTLIEVAIGGKRLTMTVEGRERYPVRVRYARELRDNPDALKGILIPTASGTQVPLGLLADIRFVRGPQVIKSEDTFLASYVTFGKRPGYAEVDVIEECRRYLEEKIRSGELVLPPGVSYRFAGTYENQVRAQRTLAVVLPLALLLIFLILYLQFRSALTTSLVFSGIVVAWAGGFILIWLYGQDWFLDFEIFGKNFRELFQVHPINLSVAIWVGFLALFGIATDDGVVIATYLDQSFARRKIDSIEAAREATVEGGLRRVRPCLMTTATTVLALLPVLTSTGRGSDIMVPMAIPSFGGMLIEIMTMLIVPVLYCAVKEFKIRHGIHDRLFEEGAQV